MSEIITYPFKINEGDKVQLDIIKKSTNETMSYDLSDFPMLNRLKYSHRIMMDAVRVGKQNLPMVKVDKDAHGARYMIFGIKDPKETHLLLAKVFIERGAPRLWAMTALIAVLNEEDVRDTELYRYIVDGLINRTISKVSVLVNGEQVCNFRSSYFAGRDVKVNT